MEEKSVDMMTYCVMYNSEHLTMILVLNMYTASCRVMSGPADVLVQRYLEREDRIRMTDITYKEVQSVLRHGLSEVYW